MSEIKFGLVSKIDAAAIMKTLDLVCDQFPDEAIAITEVGLYNCASSVAMHDYILSKGRAASMTGIDNEKDKLIHPPGWMKFIRGNSNEVYNKVPDGSQHLIHIDALHTKIAVIGDFFAYAPKVKVGGFLCFHDTGTHLDPLSGWQGVGSKDDPDMCLGGVRKALNAIGLFDIHEFPMAKDWIGGFNFELVYDEADVNDEGGGVAIFRRIK